ncbi:MAG: addiction module protein [Kiritimatiellae bacterium]|nr:addiction module protein [Kiritimatiellia bacterium]MBQ3342777.1 addiction module protein [Kiritimatiellia bacterium]
MPAVMESVRRMSADEKFTVINLIWQDIAASSDIPVPEWHFDVLKKREQSLADGTAQLVEWEDVKAELLSRADAQ